MEVGFGDCAKYLEEYRCFSSDLLRKIMKEKIVNGVPLLPCSQMIMGTVLFADISGFTMLSSKLCAEDLKYHINEYFTVLLNVVKLNGGDVIKFCGDAVMIIFAAEDSMNKEFEEYSALMASLCALQLIEECGKCKQTHNGSRTELSLHCGIASGPIHCIILGDDHRYEFLIAGDVIKHMGKAESLAKQQEVCVHSSTMELIKDKLDAIPVVEEYDLNSVSSSREIWKLTSSLAMTFEKNLSSSFMLWQNKKRRFIEDSIVELTKETNCTSIQPNNKLPNFTEVNFYDSEVPLVHNYNASIISPCSSNASIDSSNHSIDGHSSSMYQLFNTEFPIIHETHPTSPVQTSLRQKSSVRYLRLKLKLLSYRSFQMENTKQQHQSRRETTWNTTNTLNVIQEKKQISVVATALNVNSSKTDHENVSNRIRKQKLANELRKFSHETARNAIETDSLSLLSEMRTIATVFIKLDELTSELCDGVIEKSQKSIKIILNLIKEKSGTLRQFVLDDKGCVVIVCFGLQGSSYVTNCVSAVEFAMSLQSTLMNEAGVDAYMGITFGNVYCGLIGAGHRCEFAFMGAAVNLAARLMGAAMKSPYKILVDQSVCDAVQVEAIHFQALPPIKVKGYTEEVKVNTPIIYDSIKPTEKLSAKKKSSRRRNSLNAVSSVFEDRTAGPNVFSITKPNPLRVDMVFGYNQRRSFSLSEGQRKSKAMASPTGYNTATSLHHPAIVKDVRYSINVAARSNELFTVMHHLMGQPQQMTQQDQPQLLTLKWIVDSILHDIVKTSLDPLGVDAVRQRSASQISQSHHSKVVLVEGIHGVGKSVFLQQIVQLLHKFKRSCLTDLPHISSKIRVIDVRLSEENLSRPNNVLKILISKFMELSLSDIPSEILSAETVSANVDSPSDLSPLTNFNSKIQNNGDDTFESLFENWILQMIPSTLTLFELIESELDEQRDERQDCENQNLFIQVIYPSNDHDVTDFDPANTTILDKHTPLIDCFPLLNSCFQVNFEWKSNILQSSHNAFENKSDPTLKPSRNDNHQILKLNYEIITARLLEYLMSIILGFQPIKVEKTRDADACNEVNHIKLTNFFYIIVDNIHFADLKSLQMLMNVLTRREKESQKSMPGDKIFSKNSISHSQLGIETNLFSTFLLLSCANECLKERLRSSYEIDNNENYAMKVGKEEASNRFIWPAKLVSDFRSHRKALKQIKAQSIVISLHNLNQDDNKVLITKQLGQKSWHKLIQVELENLKEEEYRVALDLSIQEATSLDRSEYDGFRHRQSRINRKSQEMSLQDVSRVEPPLPLRQDTRVDKVFSIKLFTYKIKETLHYLTDYGNLRAIGKVIEMIKLMLNKQTFNGLLQLIEVRKARDSLLIESLDRIELSFLKAAAIIGIKFENELVEITLIGMKLEHCIKSGSIQNILYQLLRMGLLDLPPNRRGLSSMETMDKTLTTTVESVAEVWSPNQEYQFCNTALHQSIYNLMLKSQKAAAHQYLADYLANRSVRLELSCATNILSHYLQSHNIKKKIEYLRICAYLSANNEEYATAEKYLENLLCLVTNMSLDQFHSIVRKTMTEHLSMLYHLSTILIKVKESTVHKRNSSPSLITERNGTKTNSEDVMDSPTKSKSIISKSLRHRKSQVVATDRRVSIDLLDLSSVIQPSNPIDIINRRKLLNAATEDISVFELQIHNDPSLQKLSSLFHAIRIATSACYSNLSTLDQQTRSDFINLMSWKRLVTSNEQLNSPLTLASLILPSMPIVGFGSLQFMDLVRDMIDLQLRNGNIFAAEDWLAIHKVLMEINYFQHIALPKDEHNHPDTMCASFSTENKAMARQLSNHRKFSPIEMGKLIAKHFKKQSVEKVSNPKVSNHQLLSVPSIKSFEIESNLKVIAQSERHPVSSIIQDQVIIRKEVTNCHSNERNQICIQYYHVLEMMGWIAYYRSDIIKSLQIFQSIFVEIFHMQSVSPHSAERKIETPFPHRFLLRCGLFISTYNPTYSWLRIYRNLFMPSDAVETINEWYEIKLLDYLTTDEEINQGDEDNIRCRIMISLSRSTRNENKFGKLANVIEEMELIAINFSMLRHFSLVYLVHLRIAWFHLTNGYMTQCRHLLQKVKYHLSHANPMDHEYITSQYRDVEMFYLAFQNIVWYTIPDEPEQPCSGNCLEVRQLFGIGDNFTSDRLGIDSYQECKVKTPMSDLLEPSCIHSYVIQLFQELMNTYHPVATPNQSNQCITLSSTIIKHSWTNIRQCLLYCLKGKVTQSVLTHLQSFSDTATEFETCVKNTAALFMSPNQIDSQLKYQSHVSLKSFVNQESFLCGTSPSISLLCCYIAIQYFKKWFLIHYFSVRQSVNPDQRSLTFGAYCSLESNCPHCQQTVLFCQILHDQTFIELNGAMVDPDLQDEMDPFQFLVLITFFLSTVCCHNEHQHDGFVSILVMEYFLLLAMFPSCEQNQKVFQILSKIFDFEFEIVHIEKQSRLENEKKPNLFCRYDLNSRQYHQSVEGMSMDSIGINQLIHCLYQTIHWTSSDYSLASIEKRTILSIQQKHIPFVNYFMMLHGVQYRELLDKLTIKMR